MPSKAAKTIRLSLDLTPRMKRMIDHIAEQNGVTQAEALRRAIMVLEAMHHAKERGEFPALVDNKNRLVARIIGI